MKRVFMEEMAISKFKATCLAVLEKVKKTGQPVLITRFGHPVAEIRPPSRLSIARRFGMRTHTGVILGDIVSPISDESDWDAAQNPEADEK